MNAFKPHDHFYLDSKLFHFLLIRKFSTISRSYFSLWVLHCWVIPLSFRKGAQTFISRSSFQLIDLQSFCVFRLSRFWIIKAIALSDTFLMSFHIPSVVSSLSFKFFNLSPYKDSVCVVLFTYHLKFPGRVYGDVIMARIIGRAIAWLRKQSWPLPPDATVVNIGTQSVQELFFWW